MVKTKKKTDTSYKSDSGATIKPSPVRTRRSKRTVLKNIEQYNLQINLNKCCLFSFYTLLFYLT